VGGTARIVILASGRGSNFEAIENAARNGRLKASVVAVVSDKSDAPVLKKAADAGIPNIAFLLRRGFVDRAAYDKALAELVSGFRPDFVALAGFMRILGPAFIERFKAKVVNIHPALLPSFPGTDAQKQALDYGVKVTGCTVHFVDEGTDTGPVIMQKAVPVMEGDDEATLSQRILTEEHILYVEALRLLTEGRVRLDGRKVVIDAASGCR